MLSGVGFWIVMSTLIFAQTLAIRFERRSTTNTVSRPKRFKESEPMTHLTTRLLAWLHAQHKDTSAIANKPSWLYIYHYCLGIRADHLIYYF